MVLDPESCFGGACDICCVFFVNWGPCLSAGLHAWRPLMGDHSNFLAGPRTRS